MYLQKWMLFLWALSFTDMGWSIIPEDSGLNFDTVDDFDIRQNDKYLPYFLREDLNSIPEDREPGRRCADKMERALETIRRRQLAREKFNLNGYSLHQQLRSAPFDMYVTDMRVRLPPSKSWVRVDRCRFNPINHSLETRLLFNDLTISGRVNLFNDGQLEREPVEPNAEESCNMILRLRKAGIGFRTEPIRRERGQFNVKTDSHFLEPGFISVYAYGCEPSLKRDFRARGNLEKLEEEEEEISREMEDVFLKGIRSLLTSYMQKELQPAIKETLMKNMGYTVSYG